MSGEQLELNLFDQELSNSKKFFTRKRPWSAVKHRIMLRYIQAQCYNLGGDKPYQSRYINYVDGFAGAGKYDEGIGIENFVDNSKFWKRYKSDFLDTDGSPLIALKCAKIFDLEGRVCLRCFFVEENRQVNQKLKENCKSLGQELEYKIYEPQAFGVALPKIFEDLENYPTLFFLDTFGVKGVTFQQICSIADYVSQYKGELFLLFHNRSVARTAGQFTGNYKDDKSRRTAETYTQHLTALLGPKSERDWKQKWYELQEQEDKEQGFERWSLDYFKTKLSKESSFKGVASYEIKETYQDTRPQYSIVIGSNHPQKAFGEFLNEFFCQENELLFYEIDKSGNNRTFLQQVWERENDERAIEIKPRVVTLLKRKNQNWMPLEDVITLLILEIGNLGYLGRPKYRKIMLELYEEKFIKAKELGKKGSLTLKNNVRVVQ